MRFALLVLVLAGCAATDASGRRCSSEAPCEPLLRWMDAEREAQTSVDTCRARTPADCKDLEASAAAAHRDGLARYTALLQRVGGLPTYAMAEQVGLPQSVATPTRYMELWIWEWRTPGAFGQVRMAFDHYNGANTLRSAAYCDPAGCKSFFGS